MIKKYLSISLLFIAILAMSGCSCHRCGKAKGECPYAKQKTAVECPHKKDGKECSGCSACKMKDKSSCGKKDKSSCGMDKK